MNEAVLLKLKTIVERAVRPVQATISRKKKIREELLAHVTAVFEDELPRCADEARALIRVEQRFGNPNELARTLQETVPTIDRIETFFGRLYQPHARESLLRRACRYGVISVVVHLSLALPSIVLILLFMAKPAALGKAASGIAIASIAYGAISFLITLLSNGLQRALFSTPNRSLLKGGSILLISCLVPAFLPLDIAVALLPVLSVADATAIGFSILEASWPAFVLSPLALLAIAKLHSDEKRYVDEWAKLQLD